jgi:hypothetical protein
MNSPTGSSAGSHLPWLKRMPAIAASGSAMVKGLDQGIETGYWKLRKMRTNPAKKAVCTRGLSREGILMFRP